MAVTDRTQGGNTAVASHLSLGKVAVLNYLLDTGVNGITSGNVDRIVNVPAGAQILSVDVHTVTPEGAAATVDVGLWEDDDTEIDADGFFDGISVNEAAGWHYRSGPLAYTCDVASYIGVKANATLDTASLWISVAILDLRGVD